MLTRDQAKALIDKILNLSKADECAVMVGAADLANTRFADNQVTTSGRSEGMVVSIASTIGTRTGNIRTNETSDDALRAAVARSEELARYAPPDPEYVEPISAQKYPEVAAYDAPTAGAAQKEMLPGIRAAITGSETKKLISAGFFERKAEVLALGNKRGNFGYHTATNTDYSVTARTRDGTGSGWASAERFRLADLDAPAVSRVAIDKAVLSQKPRALEPGRYTVVLEPAAVSGMMQLLFSSPFDARGAEEGRTLFTKKGGGTRLGEKMFSEKITARCDPFDPRNPGVPWVGEVPTELSEIGQFFFGGGSAQNHSFLPATRLAWIEKATVKNLVYSRYWAKKKDVAPTPRSSQSLVIDGEDHSLDDLVRSTDRGLLVTRFWYIRYLNPQTVQLTGLTRDGLFWIEKGKITYPVVNFRWNESPSNVLANVEMLSRPVRSGERVVPAMKVRDFNFSSVSDAV
ncbi:MAG TPA: TldD/PmbA family protein [Terriglobales bacterium]|jgi:predicted Zn-dependent protease|nr:TldD/PmbA family protein [Terriglobales bacterium]